MDRSERPCRYCRTDTPEREKEATEHPFDRFLRALEQRILDATLRDHRGETPPDVEPS